MIDNNFDQNSSNPQQNMNNYNGQPANQQQPTQNGYNQQMPNQNGYYQQQPTQNGYYQQQPTQNGYYQQQPTQNGYYPYVNPYQQQEKRPMTGSTLPLAIIGLVFCLLIPLVTYVCSIISLTTATKKKAYEKTKPAIIMNIIALIVAVITHVITTMIYLGAF